MTGEQLFESLQYLDDALVEEAPVGNSRRVWLRWGAAAAAFVLVTGAVLALPRLRSGGEVPAPAAGSGEVYWTELPRIADETARPIQPGGVPGPDAVPVGVPGTEAGAPVPDILAWNDIDVSERIAADVAGVMQVAEPLTAAQTAACAPEIRLEWMEEFTGFAAYYLKDGAGGLAYIELTVPSPARNGKCTVRIRDVNAPAYAGCIMQPQPEEKVGSINGQDYRAYRIRYLHGQGDPKSNPPEDWTELTVRFVKENVEYTLSTDAPASQALQAETELRDLLLAYAGTHNVPDLSAFRCGEYLYRDDDLTLNEALSDPDFGAYLPAAGPEGFEFDFARRYQFEEVSNYLMAYWTQGRAYLQWLAQPVTEEAHSRIVTAAEPERYDLSRYPVPWSTSVPPTLWETVQDPVFRAGELTQALVDARVHTDDEGMPMCRFGVLCDSGVLLEVSAKGVPPEWLYEALTQIP